MTRLIFKMALMLAVLFGVAVMLIRAQPHDDRELREFLTPPDGCEAPCFMGIRPGVTTVEEAIAILENHEWVESYTYETAEFPLYVSVRWSGKQHYLIDPDSWAVLFIKPGSPDRVVLISIRVNYNIAAGNFSLSLGKPSSIHIEPIFIEGFMGYLTEYIFSVDQDSWIAIQTIAAPTNYSVNFAKRSGVDVMFGVRDYFEYMRPFYCELKNWSELSLGSPCWRERD